MKRVLLAGAFGFLLALQTAAAQTVIRVAPPPPRREVVAVSPGPRYVWTDGYYRWNHGAYVWAPGRYVDSAASACGVGAWILGSAARRLRLDCRLLAMRNGPLRAVLLDSARLPSGPISRIRRSQVSST